MALDIQSNDYLKLPSGTTAQRPAASATGMIRQNSTTGYPEWYNAATSTWSSFASIGAAGSVMQVIQTFKTDTYSQTSQAFTVITGLTANVTPTYSTSKILVMVQLTHSHLPGVDGWNFAIGKNGSVITSSTGDAAGSRPRGTASSQSSDPAAGPTETNAINTIPILFLDSPATTSSTTYSVMGRTANGGTLYINRTNSDRNTANYDGRYTSSITLMEIAA